MALDKYKPDPSGFRELGKKTGPECLKVAQRIATAANAEDPEGAYVATLADVSAGWNNEIRAGARVMQTADSRRGVQRRVLARVANRGVA